MAKIRIGVSGWSYDGWRGDFYPDDLPRSQQLSYLAQRVETAEINGSFYALQTPDRYRKWYRQTPADFRFAVKGSRFITHNRKLGDVGRPLANFFASGVLALGEKLGPVLWQLPERHAFDHERLDAFLDLLPRDTEAAVELARRHDDRVQESFLGPDANHRVRHALEARHESFFTREAVRLLRDHGVALVMSHAAEWPLREDVTGGFVYIRLHGAPETYVSGYDNDALDDWARKIRCWADAREPDGARRATDLRPPPRKGRDVWVYFDNDADGRAPRDARALRERISMDSAPSAN